MAASQSPTEVPAGVPTQDGDQGGGEGGDAGQGGGGGGEHDGAPDQLPVAPDTHDGAPDQLPVAPDTHDGAPDQLPVAPDTHGGRPGNPIEVGKTIGDRPGKTIEVGKSSTKTQDWLGTEYFPPRRGNPPPEPRGPLTPLEQEQAMCAAGFVPWTKGLKALKLVTEVQRQKVSIVASFAKGFAKGAESAIEDNGNVVHLLWSASELVPGASCVKAVGEWNKELEKKDKEKMDSDLPNLEKQLGGKKVEIPDAPGVQRNPLH
ncbi:hypothetical protein ACWGDS_25920 [Streptomyces sp. NPDC055059]